MRTPSVSPDTFVSCGGGWESALSLMPSIWKDFQLVLLQFLNSLRIPPPTSVTCSGEGGFRPALAPERPPWSRWTEAGHLASSAIATRLHPFGLCADLARAKLSSLAK